MNILLIGNCQVQQLEWRLKAQPFVQELHSIPIHFYGNQDFDATYTPLLERAMSEEWFILTHPISRSFESYETQLLKHRHPGFVLAMTNIVHKGLHPDIIYIGGRGSRMQGPMGDAHSRIILSSYISGIDTSKCLQFFNSDATYSSLNFYEEYRKSSLELIKRDALCDIRFACQVNSFLLSSASMFSDNHPTALLLEKYIDFICRSLGQPFVSLNPEYLPNFLADNLLWPVYPLLSRYHKLPSESGFIFKQPAHLGGRVFSLEQLIDSFYRLYSDHDLRTNQHFWSDQAHLLLLESI